MANGRGQGALTQVFKRNAVVAAIVLFVCAAVYLNWSYQKDMEADVGGDGAGKTLGNAALVGGDTRDPLLSGLLGAKPKEDDPAGEPGTDTPDEPPADGTDDTAGTTSSVYFANARLNRQQARDNALSLLQEAAGQGADQSTIDRANASIQTMAQSTVTEAQIENLVVAKGYTDCVAFIGESSVSVVVESPNGALTDIDTAKILDIVIEATGFSAGQIHIMGME